MADTYVSGANVFGSAVITGGTINGQPVANMPTTAQAAALASLAAAGMDYLVKGTAIADSSITIHPGTDRVSQYVLPAATLSTDRTTTLDGGGTPTTGHAVWLTRRDLTANTWTLADSVLGTIVVLPASPTTPVTACCQWNGASWKLSSIQYLTV